MGGDPTYKNAFSKIYSSESINSGEPTKMSAPEEQPLCLYCRDRGHYAENCLIFANTVFIGDQISTETLNIAVPSKMYVPFKDFLKENDYKTDNRLSKEECKQSSLDHVHREQRLEAGYEASLNKKYGPMRDECDIEVLSRNVEDDCDFISFFSIDCNPQKYEALGSAECDCGDCVIEMEYDPIEELMEDNNIQTPRLDQGELLYDIWQYSIYDDWDECWDEDDLSHQSSYFNEENPRDCVIEMEFDPIEDLSEDNDIQTSRINQVEELDIEQHELHSTDDEWDYDDYSHQIMYFNDGNPFCEGDIVEWHYEPKDIFNSDPWDEDFDDVDCVSQHVRNILSNPIEYQIEYSNINMKPQVSVGCQNNNAQIPSTIPLLAPPHSSLNNSVQQINASIKIFPLDVQLESILQLIYAKPVNFKQFPDLPNEHLPIFPQSNLISVVPLNFNYPVENQISPLVAKKTPIENLSQQSKGYPQKYFNKENFKKQRPTEKTRPRTFHHPKKGILTFNKQLMTHSIKPNNKSNNYFSHSASRHNWLNSSKMNNFSPNRLKRKSFRCQYSDKQPPFSASNHTTFLYTHSNKPKTKSNHYFFRSASHQNWQNSTIINNFSPNVLKRKFFRFRYSDKQPPFSASSQNPSLYKHSVTGLNKSLKVNNGTRKNNMMGSEDTTHPNKPKNKSNHYFSRSASTNNWQNSSIINNSPPNMLKRKFFRYLYPDKQLPSSAFNHNTVLYKHSCTNLNAGLKVNIDTGQTNVLGSKDTHLGFNLEQDKFCWPNLFTFCCL